MAIQVVGGRMRDRNPIVGERRTAKLLNVCIGSIFRNESMTEKHSARVSVHHEYRMLGGIQQDGVGGFRTDSAYAEKLQAQDIGMLAGHCIERSGILSIYEGYE